MNNSIKRCDRFVFTQIETEEFLCSTEGSPRSFRWIYNPVTMPVIVLNSKMIDNLVYDTPGMMGNPMDAALWSEFTYRKVCIHAIPIIDGSDIIIDPNHPVTDGSVQFKLDYVHGFQL